MTRSPQLLLSLFTVSLAVAGCVDGEGPDAADEDSQGANAEAGVPSRSHLFLIDAKSYIAPIPNNKIGSLSTFDPVQDAKLKALAVATNVAYSENPKTGAHDAEQFRVWSHLTIDVTCIGSSIRTFLAGRQADVGLEGPFEGVLDQLQATVTDNGSFALLGAAEPNPVVEPTFQIIHPRSTSKIWYKVKGHVFCDQNAQAFVVLDGVTQSNFPSVRVWATRVSGGAIQPEELLYTYQQGLMTGLWALEPKPAL